jgi:hypothetical protein
VRDLIAVDDEEVRSMRRYTAVSGHFSLTTLLRISTPSQIGTILREPRSRTLSLYLYWRTAKIFDSVLPYKAQGHTFAPLDRFMTEPRVAPAIDNQVCRMLLHGDPRIPNDGFIAEDDVDGLAFDAIAALETLGFVGVLELGDKAWRGLAQLFGVHLEPRRINVTGDLGDPAPPTPGERLLTLDALHLVAQRNAADKIIYEHALSLADMRRRERLNLAESAFAKQLTRLQNFLDISPGGLGGHRRAQCLTNTLGLHSLSFAQPLQGNTRHQL